MMYINNLVFDFLIDTIFSIIFHYLVQKYIYILN